MNMLEFLESRYVEKNIKLQTKFSLFMQAETRAGQEMIAYQRTFYKYVCYFKLLLEFWLMKAGLIEQPPIASELAKVFQEKQKAIKAQAPLEIVSEKPITGPA